MSLKGLSRKSPVISLLALSLFVGMFISGCSDDDNGTTGGDTVSSAWSVNNISPEANKYKSVWFVDENNGWAVGDEGTIVTTDDGGLTWASQSSGTSQNLWDIEFFDADTGWVVGNTGTLMYTINGGRNWAPSLFDVTDKRVRSVCFTNGHKGLAVTSNGIVLHTQNGGRLWDIDSTGFFGDLRGVSFQGVTAVAVGEGGAIRVGNAYDQITTYGSLVDTFWSSWTDASGITTENLNDVTVASTTHAWAVGDNGVILISTDGGLTWSVQTSGTTANLYSVTFDGTANGWITGAGGTLLMTTDGGSNWTAINSGVSHDLYGFSKAGSTNSWVVGSLSLLSSSNGTSYSENSSGLVSLPTLTAISFQNANDGVAVGFAGTILKTNDGGDTWKYCRRGKTQTSEEWFTDVNFADDTIGFASGYMGIPPYQGIVARTFDGGTTWEIVDVTGMNELFKLTVVNADTSFVVGGNTAARTIDGGATWTELVSLSTIDPLYGIDFTDGSNGWVVGHDGQILHTTDGGNTWTNLSADTLTDILYDITFVNATTGWTVGFGGVIYKTVDAGVTWVKQLSGTTNSLESVYFLDENRGWAVGFMGTVLYTSNGGTTWTVQPTIGNNSLFDVDFQSTTDGWIVGENGTLLSTNSGGL